MKNIVDSLKIKSKARGPKLENAEINDIEKFRDYINYVKKEQIDLTGRARSLKIAQFIGEYEEYIKMELSEEINRLSGTTMMVHQERTLGKVTDRKIHIYNAADIGYRISKGIFKDEEISKGIGLATLLHDMGQPAFGHQGENLSSKVSARKQGGPRPHNATGASQILYRFSNKIRKAINKGISMEVIKKEAGLRRIGIEELSTKFNEGEEPELENKIRDRIKELEPMTTKAIEMLSMSAGRHNGERGTANILPNYDITFEDFNKVLERCFIYEGADKEMQSANMVDAIVKISDQISSIPLDMIDGKKGGLVIDIPKSYAEPASKILGVEEQEVSERLEKGNVELNRLVAEIQEKLIEDLVNSSNKQIIKLELASWLYGKKDRETGKTTVQGLRMPTYSEYLPYTSSEAEVTILQEAWYSCVDKLSNEILQPDRMFSRQLNALFRMEVDDPRREKYIDSLKMQYSGKEEYKDFMEYIFKTTPEEYKFIKKNCHKYGVDLFREKLRNAKENFRNETSQYMSSSGDEIEQGILNYMYSSSEGISEPKDKKEYSDEEINEIYVKINNMRSMQGKKKLLLQRDERIAAQLALGYIEYRFNDSKFVDFCLSIGAITEEGANVIRKPYDPISNDIFISDNLRAAKQAYEEAEQEI